MADFRGDDLRGARFEETDLRGAVFHNVDLTGARIRGAYLVDLDLDGEIRNLTVNGVDVVPLVEAELDRRHPERAKLRPETAEGFREAWSIIEASWAPTLARARRLPPDLLHERVDGEWSFIETLRHLVFAIDAWVLRAYEGDPNPYHPLGLPHTDMPASPPVPDDSSARPSLAEIVAVHEDRMARVRAALATSTDDTLAASTRPVTEAGYPPPDAYPVRRCFRAAIREEWEHRRFAERDLTTLESR